MAKDYGIGQQIEEQQIDVYVPEYDVTVKASPAASANVVNNLARMKVGGGQKGFNSVGGLEGTCVGDAWRSYVKRVSEEKSDLNPAWWDALSGFGEGFVKGVARFPMDISAQIYDLYTSGSNYMSEAIYKSDVKGKKDRIAELQARIKSFEGLDEEKRTNATKYYTDEIAKLQDELKNLESDNFRKYLLETQKERKKASDAYAEKIDEIVGMPKSDVASGFESVMTSLLFAPAGAVGLGVAYGAAGAGELLTEMKEKGVDSDEAMRWSTIGGGLIGWVNTIGDKFILTKAVENITAKSGLMAILRGATSGGIGEFVEESGESLSTDIVKEIAGINEKSAGQVVGDAILSGIMGFITGFVFGGGSSGLEIKWKKEEREKNIEKFKNTGLSQETSEKIADRIFEAEDSDSIKEEIANLITEDIDPSKYKDADMQKDIDETVSVIPEMMNRFLMQNEVEIPKAEVEGTKTPVEEKEVYTISGVDVSKETMPKLHDLLYQAEASGSPITTIAEALQKINEVSKFGEKQKLRGQLQRVQQDITNKLQRRFGEAYGRSVGQVVAANVYAGAKLNGVTPEQYYQTMFPKTNLDLKSVEDLEEKDEIPYQDVAQRINEIDAEEAKNGVPEYTAPTININGVERQTTNSDGNPIARSEKSLRYFYNWFGDSKVVDEQGRPLVVYHATNAEFDVFDKRRTKKQRGRTGFFFSKDILKSFGDVVMPVYLNARNVLEIDAKGELWGILPLEGDTLNDVERFSISKDKNTQFPTSIDGLSGYAKEKGYDGVIVRNVQEGDNKHTITDDFIVFDPNQIKSTSNRGKYSLTDNNIYYQIAGETAKTANIGARLEAEKMLKEGKNPTDIWEKTMWMLDKDGKWKFEIDDSDAKIISSDALKKYEESVPYNRQLSELYVRRDELELKGLQGTKQYKDVQKKIDELMNKSFVFEHTTTLGELLDHKKLYEAYPELKTKRVTFKKLKDGVGGSYSYAENAFNLDESMALDEGEMLSTLLHEIQHYIQRVEDFARGGSPEEFTKEVMEQIKEKEREIFEKNRTNNYIKALQKYVTKEQAIEIVDKYKELNDALIKELESSDEVSYNLSERAEKELNSLFKKYGISEEQAKEAFRYNEGAKRNDAIQSLDDPDSFYNRLLGEIEARNTQKRMNLKEEQRRALPPFVDREYAGEEIIADNNGGIVIQPKENALFQDEANPRGAYSGNERMIYLFENADRSTFLHEMAHAWMDIVVNGKTERAKATKKAIDEFIGNKGEPYTKAQLEKFAEGFEVYCSEGKAPNNFLKNAFRNFRNWLVGLWKSIKSPDVQLNDEIRQVYKDMLGGNDVDTVFSDDADLTEIEDMVAKIEAIEAKRQEERTKKIEESADAVAEATEQSNSVKQYVGNVIDKKKKEASAFSKAFEYALKPISTRAKEVDPAFALRIRKYMLDEYNFVNKYAGMVKPLFDAYNNMDIKDRAKLDIYMKNAYQDGIDSIVNKYGIEDEYKAFREAMEGIYQKAIDVGLQMNHRDVYAPRRVKDKQEFLEYMNSAYASLMSQMKEELGDGASIDQKAEWLDQHLRTAFKSDPMKSIPGNAKERTVDVITPELNKYYYNTMDSIAMYIENMAQAINLRNMWGATKDTMGKNEGLDKSVGEVIAHLKEEGRIETIEEENEVRSILDALLGNHGNTNAIIAAIKSGAYINMLTRGSQTISQLADIGTSAYRNGLIRTLQAMFGRDITIEDVGIEKLTEELRTKEGVQKWLELGLKVTGFSALDVWGKNTYLNARYNKLQAMAKKNPTKLKSELEWAWEDETDALIDDLAKGEWTERVQLLMFSELSDVQPTTKAEMPAGYLNNPNGRVLYMLKTFAIRRMDMILNDTVRLWKEGNKQQAVSNLVFISLLMGGAEALVSILRDFIKGKPLDLNDATIEAMLGLVMMNRYQVYKASEEGWSGLAATFLPPMFPMESAFIEDMFNMVQKDMNPKDMRTWSYIPLVGDAYYWWIGGGYEKNKKKRLKK